MPGFATAIHPLKLHAYRSSHAQILGLPLSYSFYKIAHSQIVPAFHNPAAAPSLTPFVILSLP